MPKEQTSQKIQKISQPRLSKKPPVVTVMGHVDHGKSTLLDYIRKTNVAEKETGGITQRISAYEVKHKDEAGEERSITFLDTPGHEAFEQMRGRSARAADIAIVVVSAEDGAKKQTLEAYRAATEAETPVIVAISKIDKPNADAARAKSTLVENGIYLEGMGGDIPCVEISSKTGRGIPELLDMILLVADLSPRTGDAEKNAEGLVIESGVDPRRGVSAMLLIRDGTIREGSFVVAGNSLAPVRRLENFLGEKIAEARFSSPVRVGGWDKAPSVGEEFFVFGGKMEAQKKLEERQEETQREKEKYGKSGMRSGNNKNEKEKENGGSAEGVRTVPIIIKADALGAAEAVAHEIEKIRVEKCVIKILAKGVGTISENDVKTASGGTGAILLGFGVKAEPAARDAAERYGVKIAAFDIIYKLTEWLAEELETLRPRMEVEEKKGIVRIQKIFIVGKTSQVIGGKVLEGEVSLGDKVKILRRDFEIGRGEITDLQEQKNKVKTVAEGRDCGAKVAAKYELAAGDILEAFTLSQK